jgi:DNA repair protein RadC
MHEGHRQRLISRFLNEGLQGFDDHQVLELLLFFAIPRKDTNETAHQLIQSFGSISNIFEAEVEELEKINGIGRNAAVLIKLVLETSRRYRMDVFKAKHLIKTMDDAGNYATELFLGEKVEKVYLICLDISSKVINTVCVSEGTIDETPFYPRKIVAAALKHNAAKVILTHNHPGGNPKPSMKDIQATAKVLDLLSKIDIDLMDHIIVGKESFLSMAAQRFITRDAKEETAYAAQYESKE